MPHIARGALLGAQGHYIQIHRLQGIPGQGLFVHGDDHGGRPVLQGDGQTALHIEHAQGIFQVQSPVQRVRTLGAENADGIAQHVQEVGQEIHLLLHLGTDQGEDGQGSRRVPRGVGQQLAHLPGVHGAEEQGYAGSSHLLTGRGRQQGCIGPSTLGLLDHALVHLLVCWHIQTAGPH